MPGYVRADASLQGLRRRTLSLQRSLDVRCSSSSTQRHLQLVVGLRVKWCTLNHKTMQKSTAGVSVARYALESQVSRRDGSGGDNSPEDLSTGQQRSLVYHNTHVRGLNNCCGQCEQLRVYSIQAGCQLSVLRLKLGFTT